MRDPAWVERNYHLHIEPYFAEIDYKKYQLAVDNIQKCFSHAEEHTKKRATSSGNESVIHLNSELINYTEKMAINVV